MEDKIFWISILVGIIGAISILCIVVFGWFLFMRSINIHSREYHGPFWDMLFHDFKSVHERTTLLRYIQESFSDFLERRNEFWSTYGQTLIAALIIIVLTLLLLTKTISAEAGLPILSGISSFAIAKSVSSRRTSAAPPEKEQS
jgi:hypothetical protein